MFPLNLKLTVPIRTYESIHDSPYITYRKLILGEGRKFLGYCFSDL